MMPRPLALAGLLGAAVGVPYVVSNAPKEWPAGWQDPSPVASESAPDSSAQLATTPPVSGAPEGPNAAIYASPAPLEGPVGQPLDQVLRWDIDRNWVYSRWARKSTGLSDPELFGIRVPLVTGYGMTDLAGSLSYYFNAEGVLERIRFYGRTADTTRLVHLMTNRFGLQARPPLSAGDQLFQQNERKRVRAELRTRPEPIMWGSAPHASFLVELELNRPGSDRWVEPKIPHLNLPGLPPQASPQSEALRTAQQPPGDPFLPPRSVVPDGAPQTASSSAANPQQSNTASTGTSAANEAKPRTLGKPVEAPASNLQPLDAYRDRFRWPG